MARHLESPDRKALGPGTAGTDAHAENFSLLIGSAGRVRLAPLYDLVSALPYDDMHFQKLELAMKTGPDCRLRDIGQREWRRLAKEVRIDPDDLLQKIRDLADRLAARAAQCRKTLESSA